MILQCIANLERAKFKPHHLFDRWIREAQAGIGGDPGWLGQGDSLSQRVVSSAGIPNSHRAEGANSSDNANSSGTKRGAEAAHQFKKTVRCGDVAISFENFESHRTHLPFIHFIHILDATSANVSLVTMFKVWYVRNYIIYPSYLVLEWSKWSMKVAVFVKTFGMQWTAMNSPLR